jgi:hypothetical protein
LFLVFFFRQEQVWKYFFKIKSLFQNEDNFFLLNLSYLKTLCRSCDEGRSVTYGSMHTSLRMFLYWVMFLESVIAAVLPLTWSQEYSENYSYLSLKYLSDS